MKQPIKLILGGAILLALPMFLTSCDDILGEWSKPAPTPAPAKTAGEISYASATLKKATRDQTFIFDLTNTGDGTVTYSSSNTAVATIDAATGEVTPVAAGTTTITATVSDSESYTYAVKSQSYELTLVAGYSYLKWNGTALTEDIIEDGDYTEVTGITIPASWTAATPSIAAGTYVIADDLYIDNGAHKSISIAGDVNFIILDGKEFKLYNEIKDATDQTHKLNIYGQSHQTGKLTSHIPPPSDGDPNFFELVELNIHSAQVTSTNDGSMGTAISKINKIIVYGGSLKTERTGGGTGINFVSEFNVFGGKVTAIGCYDYSVDAPNPGAVITVCGGEFYANSSAGKKAINGTNITLNFASELTGKAGAYADGWETDASWGTSIATGYTGTDRCVKVTP